MNTLLINLIAGRSVLFITTKNTDYIRNSQEISILQKHASNLFVLGSSSSSYPRRLLYIWSRLLFLSCKKYDVCFVGFSPQLIIPFFFGKLKKLFIIEDFFISLYDTFVNDRQKLSSDSLLAALLHWMDKFSIQKADYVICDTNTHGDYFSEEFSKPRKNISTLYLEADTSIYYPREKKENPYKFHVLYFGSVLPLQGLSVILDAVEQLRSHPEIHFTIIGPIPNNIPTPKGEHIHYIKWLPQKELAEAIATADLCLAGHFHKTIQKARRTIPGKAYIYEAMGKPMILGDNPATKELYHMWKVPVFYVPMGDSHALAHCILHYFSSTSGSVSCE